MQSFKDPNLDKFIETNLSDIEVGNIKPVLSQVKDYLFQITSPYQASKELSSFIIRLKQLRK